MLSVKKMLTKITKNLNFTPIVRTWSNIATPTAAWYRLTTIDIPANRQYLILARNGNAMGGAVACRCGFEVVSGSGAKILQTAEGLNDSGSGNVAIGWAFIKTGNTPYTIAIRNYGYNTSVTNNNGNAIAIPLGGA